MIKFNTYTLQPGYTLTVTTPADSAGTWKILEDGTNNNTAPVSISANSTVTIGPYTSSRRIGVTNASTITQQFYDIPTVLATKAAAAEATAVVDLGNSATGTEIATAVNSII